jgi:hypothetical protein
VVELGRLLHRGAERAAPRTLRWTQRSGERVRSRAEETHATRPGGRGRGCVCMVAQRSAACSLFMPAAALTAGRQRRPAARRRRLSRLA